MGNNILHVLQTFHRNIRRDVASCLQGLFALCTGQHATMHAAGSRNAALGHIGKHITSCCFYYLLLLHSQQSRIATSCFFALFLLHVPSSPQESTVEMALLFSSKRIKHRVENALSEFDVEMCRRAFQTFDKDGTPQLAAARFDAFCQK